MKIREKNIDKRCRNVLLIMICVFAGLLFTDISVQAETVRTGTVFGISTSLNFRETPGTGNVVASLQNGDSGPILAEQTVNGALWYQLNINNIIGWAHSDYIQVTTTNVPSTDAPAEQDFESYLNAQGFPESYKEKLRTLHAQYPNWVFEAQHVGLTWNEVIAAESADHRNLVETKAISSWKSVQENDYNWSTGVWKGYDSSAWVAASTEIIQHYMDPRNLLDDASVFQFLKQSYDANMDYTSSLTSMVQGTFLSGSFTENGATKSYVSALIEAASQSGVSPYTIATIIIQEQGSDGVGGCISGTEPGYQGYYNFFNVGAYPQGSMSSVQRGLWYAQQEGWDTRTKSIAGGASIYGANYINKGQDTIYLKKFDVVKTGGLYNYQYMTNIQGATSEGQTLSRAYDTQARNSKLLFKIPVYESMPSTACAKPTGTEQPNRLIQSITVAGGTMSPAFNMYQMSYTVNVPEEANSITISASAKNPSAIISGTGTISIGSGTPSINVTVTVPNVCTNTYTLNIARGLTGWILDGNGWWYRNADGSYPYSTWQYIDGEWYYFDSNGYMATGWIYLGGTWYYLKESGAMATGWLTVGGVKYYFDESGAMKTGWLNMGASKYYFDESGAMKTGWQQIGNTKHYFKEDGTAATGWTQIGGKQYFFNENGTIATGWTLLGDTWYYIKADGTVATGWLYLGGTWYYLHGNGAMATGWIYLGGTWYYLHGSGAMATGWLNLGGTWYYLHGSGAMATGWIYLGGTWYYLHGSGAMATGWIYLGGTWYYLHGSGAMATGWLNSGGTWYYLHGSGAMAANQWVGNYYLQADGSMATSKWIGQYYVDASGLWVPGRR